MLRMFLILGFAIPRPAVWTWRRQNADGELDHWLDDSDTTLALIILLDQVTRNVYRGTARAFSNDEKALTAAHHAKNTRSLPIEHWHLRTNIAISFCSLADTRIETPLWIEQTRPKKRNGLRRVKEALVSSCCCS